MNLDGDEVVTTIPTFFRYIKSSINLSHYKKDEILFGVVRGKFQRFPFNFLCCGNFYLIWQETNVEFYKLPSMFIQLHICRLCPITHLETKAMATMDLENLL
jgi:hypothetical protein